MRPRQQLRCACHRLLAEVQEGRVVLKCSRCKRHAVLCLPERRLNATIEVRFTD